MNLGKKQTILIDGIDKIDVNFGSGSAKSKKTVEFDDIENDIEEIADNDEIDKNDRTEVESTELTKLTKSINLS